MRSGEQFKTAHDLAADWSWMPSYFRVKGGRALWDCAEYIGERLRIGRIDTTDGIRPRVRYVSPDTLVTLVSPEGR